MEQALAATRTVETDVETSRDRRTANRRRTVEDVAPVVAPESGRSSTMFGLTVLGSLGALYIINILVYTACLWFSMILTKCESSLMVLLFSSRISSIVSLIPFIGIFIGGWVQLIMIMRLSRTSFIDTFFMCVIANLAYVVVFFTAIAKLMGR